MVVAVDLSAPTARVSLLEPNDFTSFKVSVIGGDGSDSLVSAVSRIGRVSEDGRHAYIDLEALQELAGPLAQDRGWSAELRAMVEAAATHGWVTADGALEAHVEWV
jgi:hypothetical protein